MLFNTLAYAKFFAVVFVASWALAGARRARVLLLFAASYWFYSRWDLRFLPLIFASSSVDYLLGHAIHRAPTDRARRRWLVLTVALNLGVLAVFKYLGFAVTEARAALEVLGFTPPPWTVEIVLPVGVSFFTFESMSYVIDVYRRELEPHDSYAEYLTFVAFFPHLVAGPIVRPRDLLPQLARPAVWDEARAGAAVFTIATGLAKKIGIGDPLAVNLVDRVFDAPAQFSAVECYAAVVGYALQIYCDFSGYTDIAIGSAALLGVEFPRNFDSPYQSASIQEFWRRWHISLSTWLRDYLYIPLGGSRLGPIRTNLNLLATMLLGGLWHGASFTFVAWGGLHGAALAVTRSLERRRLARGPLAPPGALRRVLGVGITFHFVCVAWVFFRAESFAAAAAMFRQLGTLTTFHPNLPAPLLATLAVGLVSHFTPEGWVARIRGAFVALPAPARALALVAVAVGLREVESAEAVPFVYFQF